MTCGIAEQDRQRVGAEDRRGRPAISPSELPTRRWARAARPGRRGGPARPAAAGSRRPRRCAGRLAGEDLLGVRVGPVLADERENRGQVVRTRRARRPRETANRFLTQEPSPGRWEESAPVRGRDHGGAPTARAHRLHRCVSRKGHRSARRRRLRNTTGLGSLLNSSALGGRVTHAVDACPATRSTVRLRGATDRLRSTAGAIGGTAPAICVRLLLVAMFGLGLTMFVPGIGPGRGRGVVGTLHDQPSGPIEGVADHRRRPPTATRSSQVESDENGRWEVELPSPASTRSRIDADDLPDGVTLSGEDSRTVTVDEGRRQPVNLGARGRQPRRPVGGGVARHPAVRRRPALRPADRDLRGRPVADLRHDRADQLRARRAGHDRRRRRVVHQRRRRRAADPGGAASPWSWEPPSERSTNSACGGRCADGAPDWSRRWSSRSGCRWCCAT